MTEKIRRAFEVVDYQALMQAHVPAPEYFDSDFYRDPEAIEKRQLERLKARAVSAYKVPFFKNRWDEAGFAPGDLQSVDDLAQEVRPVVARPHAMAGEDENAGIRIRHGDQTSDGRIECDVYVLQQVAVGLEGRGIVVRVLWVVEMPELMARAVAVCEYRDEEVPRRLVEVMSDHAGLGINPLY